MSNYKSITDLIPNTYFSVMYVTFPYGLQPALPGLANQEHVQVGPA